jgi:hypothetical protein
VEYSLISSTDATDLIYRVNNKLSEGWRPQGGIFALPGEGADILWYQAVIRGGSARQEEE